MRLNITRVYNTGFTENQCNLATAMLSMKSTHLFIASNVWESIFIELEDSIPDGYLGNLNMICNNIKVNLPDKVTDKTVHLLTELYPDKAGALRRNYMQGRDVREVLKECME